jgi:hypothetical protein
VADNHYLRLDEQTKVEGAKFIGLALPAKLRGAHLVPTPTGSCNDSLHGARAPKDGATHCTEFTHCLGCPSYVIVGSLDDLHRLFSFQRFLMAEIDYYPAADWQQWQMHHHDLIAHIDRIVSDHFTPELVTQAKERADRELHPFWELRLRQVRTHREARYGG